MQEPLLCTTLRLSGKIDGYHLIVTIVDVICNQFEHGHRACFFQDFEMKHFDEIACNLRAIRPIFRNEFCHISSCVSFKAFVKFCEAV